MAGNVNLDEAMFVEKLTFRLVVEKRSALPIRGLEVAQRALPPAHFGDQGTEQLFVEDAGARGGGSHVGEAEPRGLRDRGKALPAGAAYGSGP